MKTASPKPATIDEYIAAFEPEVQAILQKIRQMISKAAPGAQEKISYQMPCFAQNGNLVYFGGFKQHIGFYPPVRDETLKKEAAKYAGEKGNLRFSLDEPIPYDLIKKIVKVRVLENQKVQDAKRAKKQSARTRV